MEECLIKEHEQNTANAAMMRSDLLIMVPPCSLTVS
jgi:hypothetical protein